MSTPRLVVLSTLAAVGLVSSVAAAQQSQSDPRYKVHDMSRPQPPVVDPGTPSTQARAGTAPATTAHAQRADGPTVWQMDDGRVVVEGDRVYENWSAYF
ncbi:MAG: hypothetical protein O2927_04365, partial [Planctomycetota bacterium]|nr:hypothetical protein [Planctomycetota bacterium]